MNGNLKGYMIISSKKAGLTVHDNKLAIRKHVVEYALAKQLNSIVLKRPVTIKEAARRLKLNSIVDPEGYPMTVEKIVEQHPLDLVIEGKWVKSTHF